jgi:hypothetical protein
MSEPSETPKKRGRPLGSPNKVIPEVRLLARAYTEGAVKTLAEIMDRGETDAVRISAANSLLDRGFGRPAQAVHVGQDEEAGPIQQVIRWAVSETEAIKDPSKRAD